MPDPIHLWYNAGFIKFVKKTSLGDVTRASSTRNLALATVSLDSFLGVEGVGGAAEKRDCWSSAISMSFLACRCNFRRHSCFVTWWKLKREHVEKRPKRPGKGLLLAEVGHELVSRHVGGLAQGTGHQTAA